jgi:type II restriction enzyme
MRKSMSDSRVSTEDLVRMIKSLKREKNYSYLNPKTHGYIQIVDIAMPLGPIRFKRINPSKGESPSTKKTEMISRGLLARTAAAIVAGEPLNIDRVVGASYNARAVLEALLAHTPCFYYCYPGRFDAKSKGKLVKRGHKHLIYDPERPHQAGEVAKIDVDVVIAEHFFIQEAVTVPTGGIPKTESQLQELRAHIHIQNALRIIGLALNYRTYIAKDNQGVLIQDKPFASLEGVVTDIGRNTLISANGAAAVAGRLLDCVWFQNCSLMPAVFEVEHTTGITSGLTRMLNFWHHVKGVKTQWVVVAPDEDRSKALSEILKPQFRSLEASFMPYSNVEMLLMLAKKGKLKGITQQFLDGWMERPIFPDLPPMLLN